jgi:hypothetical protein
VTFEFQGLRRPVVAQFNQAHTSSAGGALLLKALNDRLGVTDHELIEFVRQRVYGIACGYADCNDAARLAEDPIHKLLLGRDPLDGPCAGQKSHPLVPPQLPSAPPPRIR